jgi:hypothetical protein
MLLKDGDAGETRPRLLVLGDEYLATLLRAALEDVTVEFAETSDETEGRNIALAVVAGMFPLLEATQVRVHPVLADVPVVIVGGVDLSTTTFARLDIGFVESSPDLTILVTSIRSALAAASTAFPPSESLDERVTA